MSENKTKSRKKFNIGDYTSFIGLAAVIILFSVLTRGVLLSPQNLMNLIFQVITIGLVATGAVFVFGVGNFDISLGGAVLMCTVLSAIAGVKTGSVVLIFLVCLAVSLAIGLMKGIFASFVDVPFFIFTVVLSMVFSALALVIMGDEMMIYLKNAVKEIPKLGFSEMAVIALAILIVYVAACIFIFCFTPLGSKVKMMGGNSRSAAQSGIDKIKMELITFAISSVGIALAAFIMVIRTRSASSTDAGSIGTDVMIALVLGGMPISGGPKSKASAGIVGALTVVFLNNGLTIMGVDSTYIQMIRGIVFLAVVFITSYSYRTRLLPR